jgi:hypothetical protein
MTTKQPPAERANELLEAVPTSNIVTKTGAVILGTGLAATAISQELYVVNEETVVLAGFVILATFIARVGPIPVNDGSRLSVYFRAFINLTANGRTGKLRSVSQFRPPPNAELLLRKFEGFSINPDNNTRKLSRIVSHLWSK